MKDLHLVGVVESGIHLQTSAGLVVEKSQIWTFVGLVIEKRIPIRACVDLVKNEIDLKLAVENGTMIQFCVELEVIAENGTVIGTWVDLGVQNVSENRGPEWWEEPCSVSEPRPPFLLLVWLQQTAKKTEIYLGRYIYIYIYIIKNLQRYYLVLHHHFEQAYQPHWPCWLCAQLAWPSLHD